MTPSAERQLAYLATRYTLGCPVEPALAALPHPHRETLALGTALGALDRTARAAALAPHLTRIVESLERRRLR